MELNDALDQIAQIRQQISSTKLFRGFRSTTTAFSAAVAVVTAILQSILIPQPARDPRMYLFLWSGAAITCTVISGASIYLRYRRTDSSLERELTLLTVQQFLPCLVIGALLTYIICSTLWSIVWVLPSLWMILFGMGILAARQMLPRSIVFVGAFYMLCGCVVLAESRRISPLAPLVMAIPFVIGQTTAAAILFWQLERKHVGE